MLNKDIFRSKTLAMGVLSAFALLFVPVGASAAAEAQNGEPQIRSTLTGFVYNGAKNPLAGAVVKIRNMSSSKEYVSEPTNSNGAYKIDGIDSGWYFLSVTTEQGEFTLASGFYLKGGDTAKMSVQMKPGGTLEAWGSAYAMKKPFFSTAGGVAVIVLAAAGAGFGLYQLLKKETEVSPVLIGK